MIHRELYYNQIISAYNKEEYKNIQSKCLTFTYRSKSYERWSSVIFRKKKSIACRLKEERSIKLTLYRAYSILSRGDVSGNWKFPVTDGGGLVRGRLADRKKDLSLTMSHLHIHIRGIAVSLFRIAPSGFGLRGRRRYSRRESG